VNLHAQIAAALEALVPASKRSDSSPNNTYRMGIKTLTVRNLAQRFASEFRTLAWDDQVRLVQYLLTDGRYEMAHLGIFLLGLTIDKQESVNLADLDTLIALFTGWSVTDAFCIEVLQPLLIRNPAEMKEVLDAWSMAASRWKRRASVVVYTRKIGESGRYAEAGLQACERLIDDEDDLVRKSVGWALKDLMRGDRERVLAYVRELRSRGVSAVITLYALKDIQGKAREDALAVRPTVSTEW